MEKQIAEAIAEEIITHSDEHLATKADLAGIRGEIIALKVEIDAFKAEFRSQIKMLASHIKILTSLVIGLYIGLALLFVDKLIG